jgi:hypothetical protein
MKKFTCKEMGGPCEEVYEEETAIEIAKKSHAHVMATTDEAHKQMREQMTKPSEEEQKTWWDWFSREWDKKAEA